MRALTLVFRLFSAVALAAASLTATAAVTGCGSGCEGMTALPAPIPPDQTVEGGVQIRVTESGFDSLTSLLPALLNDTLADGFCLGRIGPFDLGLADVDACYEGDCAGGATGCRVTLTVERLVMSVPDPATFRIDMTFDVNLPIDARADWFIGGDSTCTLNLNLNDGRIVADIGFFIDEPTGELRIQLTGIDVFDISGLGMNGCGVIGDVLDSLISIVADVFSSALVGFIIDALTPVIDGFVQDLLPDPLGIEGMIDLGLILGMPVAPGTEPRLETRAVAGGYVSLPAHGLSLGMIVGLNADRDLSSRELDLDSQGAFCVPDRAAPDFDGILPRVPGRNNFALRPANEFMGLPDPDADLAFGIAETTFDLLGHHLISSGALCVGIGSETAPQLNVGTIGLLVPSLSELGLGTGREPLLLVVRPQQPIDFTIGLGTVDDPHLGIHIKELQIDFYAFIMERYTRGFTVGLDMDLGVNLDFTLDDMGLPAVQPTLVGLEADAIGVTVTNAEILRETPAQLEAVFPTLLDLVVPLLSGGLSPIGLPEIQGFTLTNLVITKVVTSEDDFLAIYSDLAPSGMKRQQIARGQHLLAPNPHSRVRREPAPEPAAYEELETEAAVVRVSVPAPSEIRAALASRNGALPEIELALDSSAPRGAPVEWQWSLNGGMWRAWSGDANLVVADGALAVQGRHLLRVRSRLAGDFRTFDRTPVELPIIIDSAPPRLLVEQLRRDGDELHFVATDLVSTDEELEFALGAPDAEPPTAWRHDGRFSVAEVAALAGEDQLVIVAVRDGQGNVGETAVNLGALLAFHGRVPAPEGCGCAVANRDPLPGGPLAIVLGALLLTGAAIRRRSLRVRPLLQFARRVLSLRNVGLFAILVGSSFTQGCDCNDAPPGLAECALDADCVEICPADSVGICQDGACFCADDLFAGDIGRYSDIATTRAGISWVSAYNSTYGDLMVARVVQPGRIPRDDYEFVDGVPEGPIVLPGSTVRRGIRALGNDVGIYTSIHTTPAGEPIVSYFDVTAGSLRFAGRFNDAWRTMEVDKGVPPLPEIGGEEAGRYSTILTHVDGRPVISYMTVVREPAGDRTELRYAQAKIAQPTQTSDWELFIVDQAPLAPLDPMAPVDVPDGIGLFVAGASGPNGPVLVYYDRPNGDLKMARFAADRNQFDTPEVIDGADGSDVGWYPSVAVTADNVVHVSYVDVGRDNLIYLRVAEGEERLPAVIDDGYRIDGTTSDGLPRPVFHFVGDDSAMIATGAFVAIAYQDATTQELLMATKDTAGTWSRETLAGNEDPFVGGYGFYAAADYTGETIVLSSYVVDPPASDAWVEVFNQPIIIE